MNLNQNKIKRYVFLDQILRDSEGHTLNEILTDSRMDGISKRSLHEYLKEFSDIFGANFEMNLYRGRERLWKYKDSSYSIFNQINKDVEIIRKAIESLKFFEGDPRYDYIRFFLLGLEDGIQHITNVISFDNNMEYYGLDYLGPISQAIIHKYPIKLTYKPFNRDIIEINVHPYHLRQYNRRWFLFGYSETQKDIHNYPLDRIESVEHLSKEYIETDINFDEYFDDIVGVSVYKNSQLEKVVLKVSNKSIDYIRTKPIHGSQKELKNQQTDEYSIIQLMVKVNTELKMLLFSYSDAIEVLEPLWLRNTFTKRIKNMCLAYKV